MTIGELCEAAIEVSDNIACNLLLRAAGGLGPINAYLRSIDDPKFYEARNYAKHQ